MDLRWGNLQLSQVGLAVARKAWGREQAIPQHGLLALPGGQPYICPATKWCCPAVTVLGIVQVVIEAGANGGVQGGSISVSNSTNGQGTQCASGINVQPGNGAASQAAVVACSAWGRYLTITASAKMNLCR